jgi:hypothetical protein
MSATQVIEEIQSLPAEEQQAVFAFVAKKIIGQKTDSGVQPVGQKLSFDEACDVVFRENRELLSLLAK